MAVLETLTFNIDNLPIRAEHIQTEQLRNIRTTFDDFMKANSNFPLSKLYKNLLDFFNLIDDFGIPRINPFTKRFQLGLKGWGKTLSTLAALNKMINTSNQKPLMLYFNQQSKSINIFPPKNIESETIWGSRYYEEGTFIKLLKSCNVFVFDDIHYIFENVSIKPSLLNDLIYFMDQLELKLKTHPTTKILFLSEYPLVLYSEQLKHDKLNKLLLSYGLRTVTHCDFENFTNVKYENSYEFPYWSFSDWKLYLSLYKIQIHPVIAYILYNINSSPRSLNKINKIYKNKNFFKLSKFLKEAKKRLLIKKIDKRIIKNYENAWSNALLDTEQYYDLTRGMYDNDVLLLSLKDEILKRLPELKSKDETLNTSHLVLMRLKQDVEIYAQARGLANIYHIFTIALFNLIKEIWSNTLFFSTDKQARDEAKKIALMIRQKQFYSFPEEKKEYFRRSITFKNYFDLNYNYYINNVLFSPFYDAFSEYMVEESSLTKLLSSDLLNI